MKKFILILIITCCTVLNLTANDAKIAIVGLNNIDKNTADLLTVELSEQYQLIERETINSVLKEHQLAERALLSNESIVELNKIIKADLFVIITKLRFVVFSTNLGIRLCDKSFKPNSINELKNNIITGVKKSVKVINNITTGDQDYLFISMLNPVNGSLNIKKTNSFNKTCELFRRHLINSEKVILLERSFANFILDEEQITKKIADKIKNSTISLALSGDNVPISNQKININIKLNTAKVKELLLANVIQTIGKEAKALKELKKLFNLALESKRVHEDKNLNKFYQRQIEAWRFLNNAGKTAESRAIAIRNAYLLNKEYFGYYIDAELNLAISRCKNSTNKNKIENFFDKITFLEAQLLSHNNSFGQYSNLKFIRFCHDNLNRSKSYNSKYQLSSSDKEILQKCLKKHLAKYIAEVNSSIDFNNYSAYNAGHYQHKLAEIKRNFLYYSPSDKRKMQFWLDYFYPMLMNYVSLNGKFIDELKYINFIDWDDYNEFKEFLTQKRVDKLYQINSIAMRNSAPSIAVTGLKNIIYLNLFASKDFSVKPFSYSEKYLKDFFIECLSEARTLNERKAIENNIEKIIIAVEPKSSAMRLANYFKENYDFRCNISSEKLKPSIPYEAKIVNPATIPKRKITYFKDTVVYPKNSIYKKLIKVKHYYHSFYQCQSKIIHKGDYLYTMKTRFTPYNESDSSCELFNIGNFTTKLIKINIHTGEVFSGMTVALPSKYFEKSFKIYDATINDNFYITTDNNGLTFYPLDLSEPFHASFELKGRTTDPAYKKLFATNDKVYILYTKYFDAIVEYDITKNEFFILYTRNQTINNPFDSQSAHFYLNAKKKLIYGYSFSNYFNFDLKIKKWQSIKRDDLPKRNKYTVINKDFKRKRLHNLGNLLIVNNEFAYKLKTSNEQFTISDIYLITKDGLVIGSYSDKHDTRNTISGRMFIGYLKSATEIIKLPADKKVDKADFK